LIAGFFVSIASFASATFQVTAFEEFLDRSQRSSKIDGYYDMVHVVANTNVLTRGDAPVNSGIGRDSGADPAYRYSAAGSVSPHEYARWTRSRSVKECVRQRTDVHPWCAHCGARPTRMPSQRRVVP